MKVNITLPGDERLAPEEREKGTLFELELADDRWIEGDDSTFTRADAVLDFEQAEAFLKAWCPAQTASTGNRYSYTTGGDPEGDDDLEFIIAFTEGDNISFERWGATTEFESVMGNSTEYGYGLDAFPFHVDFAVAPLTLDEWVEENLADSLFDIATKLWSSTLDSDGDDNTQWKGGYRDAVVDFILGHLAHYEIEVPEGFRGYIVARIAGGAS